MYFNRNPMKTRCREEFLFLLSNAFGALNPILWECIYLPFVRNSFKTSCLCVVTNYLD